MITVSNLHIKVSSMFIYYRIQSLNSFNFAPSEVEIKRALSNLKTDQPACLYVMEVCS